MSLPFFDLESIGKKTNIKIINSVRGQLIYDNICAKIKAKYGISREPERCFSSDQRIYTIQKNTFNHVYVFDNAMPRKYHFDMYSAFIRETDYHNYLFCYNGPRGTLMDTDFTFVRDEKTVANIELIYNKIIDKDTYTLEYAIDIFQKHNAVVISNNGKSLMQYETQNMITPIHIYHEDNWNSKCVSGLIDKINDNNFIYHTSDATLHRHLLSRFKILKSCHYALFLLTDNFPSELCDIILNLLIILCGETKTKKDIAMMCVQDFDNHTHAYWNTRIMMLL
uniref:Uncharacterized protein n=1 Tax=viral metagenome TaxID=1070528 RepID=A0A6C0C9D7_9ZZZZ